MGHREELLAAARRLLIEKGYARTTARDLVAESATNLASIGYHFGSKEALLAEALDGVFLEYAAKMVAIAATAGHGPADPAEAVRASWVAMTDMQEEFRPFLVAFVEALAQAERSGPLRAKLAAGYEEMRQQIIAGVQQVVPDAPGDVARAVASFFIAVSDGYMVQWLLDPDATPGGAELLEAARLTLTA